VVSHHDCSVVCGQDRFDGFLAIVEVGWMFIRYGSQHSKQDRMLKAPVPPRRIQSTVHAPRDGTGGCRSDAAAVLIQGVTVAAPTTLDEAPRTDQQSGCLVRFGAVN
jgi:hypothetical protein